MKGIIYENALFCKFYRLHHMASYEISKSRRIGEKAQDAYWERENAANNTRRKSLDNLRYIVIPFDSLPMETLKEDEKIIEFHKTLYYLSESPIVNFTGFSNTDLKLEYGAPNIDLLARYDQSYTTLARTLQQWAEKLYQAGYVQEAKQILEFSISTDTDVSGSYRLLASIYSKKGETGKIKELEDRARHLKSASRNIIVRILQQFDP